MLKRPVTQQLQTESFVAVQSIVNNLNCELRKTDPDNAGLDGEIDLVKQGVFQGKIIKFQLKAGHSYISSENKHYIKVKIEKKYIDLWAKGNFPVILFFYHPDTKLTYWKGIKEYLKINPNILRKTATTVNIPFDKRRDKLDTTVLPKWFSLIEGKFEYEKIIYTDEESEIIWSNWYPVIDFPRFVFKAPTSHERAYEITSQLEKYYCFILRDKHLYTFSNLENTDCELIGFCDAPRAEKITSSSIPEKYLMELLNNLIRINLSKKDMTREGERYYFHPRVLEKAETSIFYYTSVKGRQESRVKVYRQNMGDWSEMKHHAIQSRFQHIGNDWYLELEPDWHFTYRRAYKSRKEIGIRITKEKADMYNEQYKYHLYAMKQFIADDQPVITLVCDELTDSQKLCVDGKCISPKSNFILFNDYSNPEEDIADDDEENDENRENQ